MFARFGWRARTYMSHCQQLAAALLLGLAACSGFTFELPAGADECFEEKVAESDHVSGGWDVAPGSVLHAVTVLSPAGDEVYSASAEQSGSFDYYATASGTYSVCFSNAGESASREVHAKIEIGDPPDLIQLAKTEHLSPIEERIKSLHESMIKVRDLQDQIKAQDEKQQKMTLSTRSWLLYLTVIEAAVLVATSAWQILHLRSFFEVKRVV